MKKYFLTALIFIFVINLNQAQILKRVQDRIERKIEQKLNQKIDKKVDEEVDEAFESLEKGEQERESNDESVTSEEKQAKRESSIADLFGGTNVEPKANYNFKGEIVMEITNDQNDKPINMTMLYSKANNSFAIKMLVEEKRRSSNTIMVFEGDDVISFIETDGQKMYMAMSTKQADRMTPQSDTEFDPAKLKKTGKTKNILGYKCEQYIITEDDTNVTAWITKSLDFPNYYNRKSSHPDMEGFALQYIIESDGNGTTTVNTISVDKNKVYNLDSKAYKSIYGGMK